MYFILNLASLIAREYSKMQSIEKQNLTWLSLWHLQVAVHTHTQALTRQCKSNQVNMGFL